MAIKPFLKSLSKNLFLKTALKKPFLKTTLKNYFSETLLEKPFSKMILKKHFLSTVLKKHFFKLRFQNYFSEIVFRIHLFIGCHNAHSTYVSAIGQNPLTKKRLTFAFPLLSLCSGDSRQYLNGKNNNIRFLATNISKLEGHLGKRD